MNWFKIADMNIKVSGDCESILEELKEFEVESQKWADLEITFSQQNYLKRPEGRIIKDDDGDDDDGFGHGYGNDSIKWLKKPEGEDGYYLYSLDSENKAVLILLEVDSQWRKATLHYIKDSEPVKTGKYDNIYKGSGLVKPIMGMVFRYCLLHKQGVVIHSAAIEWEGKGILFSAPSGTGKSTQARLWKQYIGDTVKILNDDTPAIRVEQGIPYVYGTPWSGSSDIHTNGYSPIVAIVVLEQASANSIVKLEAKEALMKLLPRFFLPYFDEKMLDKAIGVFEELITSVPIYHLKCRPDKEAVEMIYQCVK